MSAIVCEDSDTAHGPQPTAHGPQLPAPGLDRPRTYRYGCIPRAQRRAGSSAASHDLGDSIRPLLIPSVS